MLCKLCGGEIRPGDKFCRTCGGALDLPAPEVPAVPVPPWEAAPAEAETAPAEAEAAPAETEAAPTETEAAPGPVPPWEAAPAEAETAPGPVTLDRFPDDFMEPPAAPQPPAAAVGVLTAAPAAPEAQSSPDGSSPDGSSPDGEAGIGMDPAYLPEGPSAPPPESTGRRVAGILAAVGLTPLLLCALWAAVFSLSLLTGGTAQVLAALCASLPAPEPVLQALTAWVSPAGAAGLALLALVLFCFLARVSGRPAVAFRCLGGAVAAAGALLVLSGLYYERLGFLPAGLPELLAESGALKICFTVGFILIVAGLLTLIVTLAIRRRGSPRRGTFYRGGLRLLAAAALTASAVLLTFSAVTALYTAVPVPAPAPALSSLEEARSALAGGDYAAALELVGTDAARGVGDPAPCLVAAQALLGLGDLAGAEETLRAALSASPNDAALCAELSGLLTFLGDEAAALAPSNRLKSEEAIAFYREVLTFSPGAAWPSLAIASLERLWTIQPGPETVYRWIAVGDVTWTGAVDAALSPGNVQPILADKSEFDAVTAMADGQGLRLVWLPAKLADPADKTSAKWISGEKLAYLPWHSTLLPGQTGEEASLALYKIKDAWYLVALPDDPALFAASGTVGYLCENRK